MLAKDLSGAGRLAEQRREILSCISSNQIVPPKHFYNTSEGTALWLELSRQSHTEYDFYGDSVAALSRQSKTLVDKVAAATRTAQINFVSVGCGDGVKDNVLLRELDRRLDDAEQIGYFALDISDALVAEAVGNALAGLNPEHFRVTPLVVDYSKMKQHLDAHSDARSAPKLFAVLGNTVGNADEQHLMDAIAQAMAPGDLVLLEVNIGAPDITDLLWRNPTSLEHDFVPLSALGVPFDPTRIDLSLVEGESVVEGTKSVLISYRDAELDGLIFDQVKLFLMHYYDQQSFVSAIERQMNVKVLWAEAVRDVYQVLASKVQPV